MKIIENNNTVTECLLSIIYEAKINALDNL